MPKTLLFDVIDGQPVLSVKDMPAPEPGPGEVRCRVHAIGLNRSDIMYMDGVHYNEINLPTRLGYEGCGIVDAVGPDVADYKVGDRVCIIPSGDHRYCTAGEWSIAPARFLTLWPDGFSAEEAAATWMQYMTGYFPLVEIGEVRPGDAVLITAASSSAGIGAIQLTKLLGGTAIATTRTSEKKEFLFSVGADHVVVTEEARVADDILAATKGKGVRIVYDAVAGPFMNAYAGALAPKARIFVYGALNGSPTIEVETIPLVRKCAIIEPYSLINYAADPDAIDRGRRFLSLALRAGALRPLVDRIFELEQASAAYDYMRTGAQRGKIVLRTQLA